VSHADQRYPCDGQQRQQRTREQQHDAGNRDDRLHYFPAARCGSRQMFSTPLVRCEFEFPSGKAMRPSITIGLFQ
jgi:hypothetical protein